MLTQLAWGIFVAGYLLLTVLVAVDAWVRELLTGFGEIAMIVRLLFLYSGGERGQNGRNENLGELLTADIDEVPLRTAQPLLEETRD
jgi:hypothetical protein